MGFKKFVAGAALAAADVDMYLMNQVTIACTSTTRPANPQVGMRIYETDTLVSQEWNGWAWHGGWNNHSPVVTQGGQVASTPTYAEYICVNGRVMLSAALVIGGNGTYGSYITIGTPPLQPIRSDCVMGTFWYSNAGASNYSSGAVLYSSGRLMFSVGNTWLGVTPQFALASGDTLNYLLNYHTAQ